MVVLGGGAGFDGRGTPVDPVLVIVGRELSIEGARDEEGVQLRPSQTRPEP